MGKRWNWIVGICLCGMFLFVGCGKNEVSNNAQSTEIKLTQEEQFKKDYEICKNAIASNKTILEQYEAIAIEKVLKENTNRNEVKNDLFNLAMSKLDEYFKSSWKDVEKFDKMQYIASQFYRFYPDNEKTKEFYVDKFLKTSKNTINDSPEQSNTQTTTPTVPTTNNLTSADGMLELLDYKSENGYIVGTIRNNSDTTYRYVEVDINLFDANDNQVGSTLTNVNNLEPHKSWKFKAVVLEKNTKRFKIVKIYGLK